MTIYNQGLADLIIQNIAPTLLNIFHTNWDSEDTLVIPGDSLVIDVMFTPQEVMLYQDSLIIDNSDVLCYVQLEGEGLPSAYVGEAEGYNLREFALYPPYPNPFNPSTAISYQLQAASFLKLAVYNIEGREVAKLVDGYADAGFYETVFDGSGLTSGVYFARLEANAFRQTQKLLLLK